MPSIDHDKNNSLPLNLSFTKFYNQQGGSQVRRGILFDLESGGIKYLEGNEEGGVKTFDNQDELYLCVKRDVKSLRYTGVAALNKNECIEEQFKENCHLYFYSIDDSFNINDIYKIDDLKDVSNFKVNIEPDFINNRPFLLRVASGNYAGEPTFSNPSQLFFAPDEETSYYLQYDSDAKKSSIIALPSSEDIEKQEGIDTTPFFYVNPIDKVFINMYDY